MNAETKQYAIAFALTCPLLLNEQEQENPYLYVKDFFDFASLEEYKEELALWFKSALSLGIRYENANNLIFLHSQITQLLNAGFLIASQETNIISSDKRLTYIAKILTVETTITIRYGLREWLFSALTVENDLSHVEPEYSFALYELLLKIIEEFDAFMKTTEIKQEII